MNSRTHRAWGEIRPVVIALVAAFVLGMIGYAVRSGLAGGGDDFASFYASANQENPYASTPTVPNLNAPGTIWALRWITSWNREAAYRIWIGLSLLAGSISLWLMAPVVGSRWLVAAWWTGATLTGALSIYTGQLTFFLMVLSTAAWLADRRGHSLRAGLLMGVLIYAKPFLGIFWLYWIWRRDWIAATGAGLVSLTLLGITAILLPRPLAAWLVILRQAGWYAHPNNASVWSFLVRLNVPESALVLASAAIVVATFLRLERGSSRDRQWAAVAMAALLASPLGWTYYLPLFAGPLTMAVQRSWMILLLLTIPSFELARWTPSLLWMVTVGSVGFWAVAMAWCELIGKPHANTVAARL